MTKRELVPTMIRTEFGDVLDDPAFYDNMGAAMDHTYVPGYSDLRRERDQAILKAMQNRTVAVDPRTGEQTIGPPNFKHVPSLPVRLQWARTSAIKSGQPDNAKEVEFGSQNYRFVTKADIGKPWCKDLPAGASWQADGSLKKGDTTLMVCDAKHAAKNAALNQKAIERMHKDTGQAPLRGMAPESQLILESEKAPAIAAPPSRV